ncbi:UNVERIFIED_CONTAM: hypothetical protein HDU68_002071, partial [Siphonaria sp. JEL0065]
QQQQFQDSRRRTISAISTSAHNPSFRSSETSPPPLPKTYHTHQQQQQQQPSVLQYQQHQQQQQVVTPSTSPHGNFTYTARTGSVSSTASFPTNILSRQTPSPTYSHHSQILGTNGGSVFNGTGGGGGSGNGRDLSDEPPFDYEEHKRRVLRSNSDSVYTYPVVGGSQFQQNGQNVYAGGASSPTSSRGSGSGGSMLLRGRSSGNIGAIGSGSSGSGGEMLERLKVVERKLRFTLVDEQKGNIAGIQDEYGEEGVGEVIANIEFMVDVLLGVR